MKVSIVGTGHPNLTGLSKVFLEGPRVMTLEYPWQINDELFKPIAAMYSQFESYALRAEKMYDALIQLGGQDLVVEMLNLGQVLSLDLGVRVGQGYVHGLHSNFSVHHDKTSMSMVAVHFTDWVFQMVMDKGEDGQLDGEHAEFDELIQSLRDTIKSLL